MIFVRVNERKPLQNVATLFLYHSKVFLFNRAAMPGRLNTYQGILSDP